MAVRTRVDNQQESPSTEEMLTHPTGGPSFIELTDKINDTF